MYKHHPISILVVDDHVLMLNLWSKVLSRDSRFNIVGEASSGAIAIEMARHSKPDIILMDIQMGPIDGFEATQLIRPISPHSKIIGLSATAQTTHAKKMKSLGAMGFVCKSSSFEEMILAIVNAMNGNFYYCRTIRNCMEMEQKIMDSVDYESSLLTSRELEITDLIKRGYSSKEIADELNISFHTVQTHRNNIFKKLKVSNVASLIQTVLLKGIEPV